MDYRKIHEIGEDKEEILPGDVRDNFRVFLRCRIKTRALDSDIMNDHDEKVNEYEEYLDQFQRDQMIVKNTTSTLRLMMLIVNNLRRSGMMMDKT